MLRDITLGQYYPVGSPIHRLDPRVKLMGTLVYIVAIFLADSIWGYALAVAFLGMVIAVSGVPVGHILKGLKAIFIIVIFTVVFNLFLTPGEELFHIWKLTVTKEGVERAAFMTVRLVCLVMGASLMTFTTTPTALTDGIEKGLGFLKVLHVPVHEVAMMMSIALRFIPTLLGEADKTRKAQKARGADFDTGGLIKKAKAMVPLLVPLFVSAFRRASDLAQAMEARCYRGGAGRTRMKQLKFRGIDALAALAILLLLGAVILLNRFHVF